MRASIWQGIRDALPLVLAAIPFGLIYGALAQSAGLPAWAIMAMSLLVFAGAAQFIAVGMLAAGAFWPMILLTVFVVNLRHLLYAASLMPVVGQWPRRWRWLLGFWLTDEAYATLANFVRTNPPPEQLRAYALGAAGFMYGVWQLCSALGLWLGQQVPDMTNWGLDVAMVVAFAGIVVLGIRERSQVLCVLIAAPLGIWTYTWPYNTGLLFSTVTAIVCAMLVKPVLGKASHANLGERQPASRKQEAEYE